VVDATDFVAAIDEQVASGAVAVCLSDLDHFKELNDDLGSEAGDAVLAAFVRTMSGSLPPGAIVRRLGGDEFGVALPDSSAENALIVLNEILEHLTSHPVDGVGRPCSATFGIAARPPHAQETGDVLRCANVALMRGKREGGGRVAIYADEKMVLKSNYYPPADLDRLTRLATRTGRTEASLLREALDGLIDRYRDQL
jgi:diguanylate cyclase (GGDEF)-like protein